MNVQTLADQLLRAFDSAQCLPLPSATEGGLTMADAYAASHEIRRRRIARGEQPRGYKIGFTNRGIWPKYDVHEPIWAPVWDSTLRLLDGAEATVSLTGLVQPRLEPEIVFGFARAAHGGMSPGELLGCIEWVAHGFEIVHTHFDGWRFQAADTVADFALHGRLLVGPRVALAAFGDVDAELAALQLTLSREGEQVDEGVGSAVLDGPLRALRTWLDAMGAQPHGWAVAAGDVVTTGTITDAWPIAAGQTWQSRLSDMRLTGLTLRFED